MEPIPMIVATACDRGAWLCIHMYELYNVIAHTFFLYFLEMPRFTLILSQMFFNENTEDVLSLSIVKNISCDPLGYLNTTQLLIAYSSSLFCNIGRFKINFCFLFRDILKKNKSD